MSEQCIGAECGDGNSCGCHTHRVEQSRCGGKRSEGHALESGAGESGSPRTACSSSDDSTVRRTIRCVNPAIFVEKLEPTNPYDVDITPHPHYKSDTMSFQSERSSRTSIEYITSKSCKLDLDTARSDASNNSQTAREMQDTFRLSVYSRSTTDTERRACEDNERKKQIAFQEWLERKETEKREKARRERERREAQAHEAERRRTEEAREAAYRAWLRTKRTRAERERAEEIARRERLDSLVREEENRKLQEKEDNLKEWVRRKEEKYRESQRAEAERAAVAAERERQRCELGAQAYRDWLRHSRHKPRPVPLNQGELSMRGSMAPMYVNPVPWQSIT